MTPLHIFLLAFMTVCFSIILMQKELPLWQKISLLINPLLITLLVFMTITHTRENERLASELADAVNAAAAVMNEPGMPRAKEGAAVIREYLAAEEKAHLPELTRKLNDLAADNKPEN